MLEKTINDWFERLDITAVTRTLDLTTMDGSKYYGTLEVKAAPLTFDEWRKYAEIIIPNIKNWIWLATAWTNPRSEGWYTGCVCSVNMVGNTDFNTYDDIILIAPAFILDKTCLI